MEWTTYNVEVARLMAEFTQLDPDALVRFDFLGEGWGFSWTPDSDMSEALFGNAFGEVYGEGLSPLSALEDALFKLRVLVAAA